MSIGEGGGERGLVGLYGMRRGLERTVWDPLSEGSEAVPGPLHPFPLFRMKKIRGEGGGVCRSPLFLLELGQLLIQA